MPIKIQKAHQRSKRVTLDTGPGLTEQSHKKECDMNYILRDYAKTGFVKHAKKHDGAYDDVSSVDFQEAMNVVARSKTMFEELPAAIRANFANDVSQFLAFVQEPGNSQRLQEMGVIYGNDGLDRNGKPSGAPVVDEPSAPIEAPVKPSAPTEAPVKPSADTSA